MQLSNNNAAPAEQTFHSNTSSSPAAAQQQMHNANLLQHLGQQIEFYFSEANLIKDDYLRQFLEQNNGMVPIDMIINFPMMRKIYATYLWGPNLSCPVEALPPVDPTVVVQSVLLYSSNVYLLQGQWLVHPFFHQNLQHQQQQQQQQRGGRRTSMYHQRRKTTSNENRKLTNKNRPDDKEADATKQLERNAGASRQGHADELSQAAHTIKHLDKSVGESHGKDDAMTSPTVTPTSFASNESTHVMTPAEHQDDEPSPSKRGKVIRIENMPEGMIHAQVCAWLARKPRSGSMSFRHLYIKPDKIEQCENNPAVWWLTFNSFDKANDALLRLDRKCFLNGSKPLCKICSETGPDASDGLDREETALANNTAKPCSTSHFEGVVEDNNATEQPEQEMMRRPKAQLTTQAQIHMAPKQAHDAPSFMGSTMTVTPSANHYPAVFTGGSFAQFESQRNATPYTAHQQEMSTDPTVPAYPTQWYFPSIPTYSPTGTSQHHQTGFVALPVGYPVMPHETNHQQHPVFYGQPPQSQVYPVPGQQMRRHSAPPTSPPRNLHHRHHPAPIVHEPVPPANNEGFADFFPIQPFAAYHTDEFWHGTTKQENVPLANSQMKNPPHRDKQKWRQPQRYQQEHHRRQYEANRDAPDMASLYISPPEQQTAASWNQEGISGDGYKNKKKNKPNNKNKKSKGPPSNRSDTNTPSESESTPPPSGNGGKRTRKKGLHYALNSEFPPLAPTDKNSNNKPKKANSTTVSKGYAKVLLNTANEEEHTESV